MSLQKHFVKFYQWKNEQRILRIISRMWTYPGHLRTGMKKEFKDYFMGLDIPWPPHDWHTQSWQSQCWSCPSRSILWLSCLPWEYQRDQSCIGLATFLPKIHKAEQNSLKKWNLTVFSFLFNIIFKNYINFNSIILLLQF